MASRNLRWMRAWWRWVQLRRRSFKIYHAAVAKVVSSILEDSLADSKGGQMDDNTLYDILREKGMLKGPKRREAVRINTLTAFGGVSSKWCCWFRCTSAKKVPRKIVARLSAIGVWAEASLLT